MHESELIFGLLASFKKKEYSFDDIAWLVTPFDVSESSLRTNLSRMVANNVIAVNKVGRKAYYHFTERSEKMSSNVSRAFYKPDWTNWKNEWWGISVSLPSSARKLRYRMYKKLEHYRFATLHPGFWIRPLNPYEKLEEKISEIIRHPGSKVVQFSFYTEEDLTYIPVLWKIKEINNQFKKCLDQINEANNLYNLNDPKEALTGKMTLGHIIVQQLVKDPLLPERFLPKDWEGDNLRIAFKKWDSITTIKSKPYWEQIYAEEDYIPEITSKIHGTYR